MTEQEFNPEDIIRITEDALREGGINHLSFMDFKVLEILHNILPKYLDPSDAPYIISEIRSQLYDGFRIPSVQSLHSIISKCIKCKGELTPNPQMPQ